MWSLLAQLAAPESGGALDNLPDNPALAWGVLVVTALGAISPVLLGKITGKKEKGAASNWKGDTPASGEPATPRLDGTQQLLHELVSGVQKNAEMAASKYTDLEKRYFDLMERYVKVAAEVDRLRSEAQELRDEVNRLRGRLEVRRAAED